MKTPRSPTLVVGVVNGEEDFSGFRKKSSDFAVVPGGDDGRSVAEELERGTLHVRHRDAQHFLKNAI